MSQIGWLISDPVKCAWSLGQKRGLDPPDCFVPSRGLEFAFPGS